MKCSNCGNPNVTGKFCTKCGQPAPVAHDTEDYDESFNPYESVARQRSEIAEQQAPQPRRVEPQITPQQQQPQASPEPDPEPIQKKGYKPTFGEKFRTYITDPATFYSTTTPVETFLPAIVIFILINALQLSTNLVLYTLTRLAEQPGYDRFMYKAALVVAYPIVISILAWVLLAIRTRSLPDPRMVFAIYGLGFTTYLIAALPLPATIPAATLLGLFHIKAGFSKSFEVEPFWYYLLAIILPTIFWLAAGAATQFRIFL